MKKTGRPVSPHVTIYSFPIGALSSITNRLTGTALSFGAAGIGAVELAAGPGSSLALMQSIGGAGPAVAAGAKLAVSFPLVFHYLGAVRHTMWDYTPEYLETVGVEKTSYVLFGAAAAGSLALALI